MPSFVVTTPTTEVSLDATRKGKIPVTVSNISGRPLRVRLNLVPTAPMEAAWLSVEGEAEQEFANGASSQFTAVVTIPATAPAGTYIFKPVAAAEDRPMEEFTEGQPLSAKVGEPKVKKKFPWWMVAAAVGVLVLAVVLVKAIGGGGGDEETAPTTAPTVTTLPATVKVRVPDVVGEKTADAKAEVESVGLAVRFVVLTSAKPVCNGTVIAQDPVFGSMADGGTIVVLLIPPTPANVRCFQLQISQEIANQNDFLVTVTTKKP
jgi:hypothetical protein